MLPALWLVGLTGLVVATLVAAVRARVSPTDVVARGTIVIAGVAYIGLVVAAVWAWGGDIASDGHAARLRDGALVHLALEAIHVPLDRSPSSVPGDHAIEIARDAAHIEPGPGGVATVRGPVLAALHAGEDGAAAAAARGCAADGTAPNSGGPATYTLPIGAAAAVIECDAATPVRAFVVRNLGGELAITPFAWRGRFVAEQLTARAGDALRIGGADDAIPGLTTWDVVAPHGAAAMLAVPTDPTDCSAWSPESTHVRAIAGGCAVEAGPFAIAAVPLVPDADGVEARALRAAIVIGAPPLLGLMLLLFAARSGRRMRGLGRGLRLCTLGAALTALLCWRLLWAYRIDMLRDLATVGPRLLANQLAVIAVGAALAGNAALAHDALEDRGPVGRGLFAILAWATWLAIGSLVVGQFPTLTPTHAGVLALSLAAALAPVAVTLGARIGRRLGPGLALAVIAAGAVAGRVVVPHSALVKLGLAYAFVLAAHGALRIALVRETSLLGRVSGVALLGVAALALARYDLGVTLAIAGTGLALAMLVAGHDAAYSAADASRIGVLEREHARLLAVHGAATIALALGVAACVLIASDRALITHGALAAVEAPLIVAALFAAAAVIARSHRRGWAPWLCAALAALGVWAARGLIVERATGGDSVGARRVGAVLEPGYALLRDERAFVANASAWREAALPQPELDAAKDRWTGEGYFGARVRDIGVSRSIDNDYLPVLIARETGVAGLTQTIALLLIIAIGAGAIASLRLRHAGREHRARWLITAVAGTLAVYQPLAALGVLPLTGISWPGLGIDSPADLWLFVIGAVWCLMCGDVAVTTGDERVRRTARLRRARAIVLAGLGVATVAGVIVVARAGFVALGRIATEDVRIDEALRYASSIACPWPEHTGAALADAVPVMVAGVPHDDATARFDRELRARFALERPAVVAALASCSGASLRAGHWSLARDGDGCTATLRTGLPTIQLRTESTALGTRGTCSVALSETLIAGLRAPQRPARAERVRVVAAALGVAASDVGELVAGTRVVRLRPGAPAVELAGIGPGVTPASRIAIAGDVALEVRATPRGVVLHGDAELFVAEPGQPTAWRRMTHGPEVVLERITLIAAGSADHRLVVLFRPPREWTGSPPVVDTLLADDTSSVGGRSRRAYPYGASLPELGWVNPFDVDHSLGLDGWIHAALRRPGAPMGCGTLTPPAIDRTRVCSPSPLDGVLECRVTLQPELSATLHALATQILAEPKLHTGRDATPVRVGYVVLRGDSGELLAQGNLVPGRGPLAYAPVDASAEAELVRLRESHGESDAERVEWNLPIAVGSTFKPIVARAAEQAFPDQVAQLALTADGHGTGCKPHHGVSIDPLLGHCPPTSLADPPSSAGLHDYLAHSLNWYQAALGLLGLGLPNGTFAVNGESVALPDIVASDLASWPASSALQIADSTGSIIAGHGVVVDGLRRTPLWTSIEALLGRSLCTLGARGRCEAVAERADVCAARALPIAGPSRDLRYLVALGPSQLDLYPDDRPAQAKVPITEYFQLLRGSGVHAVGSLAQLTDAFGRVIYEPTPAAPKLAASWFPAPAVGVLPAWSCATPSQHPADTVLGADGGLCAVMHAGGTAQSHLAKLLADQTVVIYGAKTGTIDSLADIARRPAACQAWNDRHAAPAQLVCGKQPPDDSLFVIAFGVVTAHGTIPITLGIQLQRAGKGTAAHVAPELVSAIAAYLR